MMYIKLKMPDQVNFHWCDAKDGECDEMSFPAQIVFQEPPVVAVQDHEVERWRHVIDHFLTAKEFSAVSLRDLETKKFAQGLKI